MVQIIIMTKIIDNRLFILILMLRKQFFSNSTKLVANISFYANVFWLAVAILPANSLLLLVLALVTEDL